MSEVEERAVMTSPFPLGEKTWVLILLACYVYVHYFQNPQEANRRRVGI